jgi:Sodium/hydrogen exchanger family
VLCRILTELKLLHTPVGVIVLSAGVGNDVVGWILLALCVALVNSGTGLTALYVLLVAVGYCLLLVYAVRPAFLWVLRKSGSLQNGPSQSIVALTLLMVLTSSFFTSAIGIHAIFGAFMIGLICPHEGGFAVKIVEKLEDVISVLLLPLYFALSGLSTNIGLLDNGITWAYVVGVVVVAFCAKILGGLIAARANGLVWRESATIGVLMSCKGLVELIVLNIGLQARILSTRTFTIFVVMALITTFATTPLTSLLYPESYQRKLDLWKRGKIDWNGNSLVAEDSMDKDKDSQALADQTTVRSMLVYLRLDGLPSLFTFINLLGDRANVPMPGQKKHHLLADAPTEGDDDDGRAKKQSAYARRLRCPLQVHGLRLIELTERDSSVMKVSEIDEYGPRDPVVKAFRTFGQFSDVAVAGDIAVVPERSYAETLMEKAEGLLSDFVLIPWSETGSMSEQPSFQALSKPGSSFQNDGPYIAFLNEVFERSLSNTNIGVFIDRAEAPTSDEQNNRALTRTNTGAVSVNSFHGRPTIAHSQPLTHHIIVPFFGTNDDRFAVYLALQLAKNENITATIIHFAEPSSSPLLPSADTPQTGSVADTEASGLAEKDLAADGDEAAKFFTSVRDNLSATLSSRVVFQSHSLDRTVTSADIVAVIEKSIAATTNDASIDHIIISSRSNSTISNNAAGSTNTASMATNAPQTPKTAGSMLSPMANALGMQAPNTPNGGHESGECRVLGGLGSVLWEATRSGKLRAGVLIVQAKKQTSKARQGSKTNAGGVNVVVSEA